MRWQIQLGINSTSDVCKFRQNWTSRRGDDDDDDKLYLTTLTLSAEAGFHNGFHSISMQNIKYNIQKVYYLQ